MFGKQKQAFMLKAWAVFVGLAFATSGLAARIVPSGTVSIIKDGNVIGEFSQEAPLPEGALLRCEAKCAIQLDDVYMVAEPNTVFSVSPMANHHDVLVQRGTVFYSLKESSRPLHFNTPVGNAATGDLSINQGELLRGYVRVVGNETEIAVMGGGSMILATESGEIEVASGKKITITLAGTGKPAPGAPPVSEQEGLSTNTKYTIGAITGAIAFAGLIALGAGGGGGDGGGGGGPIGSPSSP